jgi:hypothetical protein
MKKESVSLTYVKIPTPAVIFTAILLVVLSFYSGIAWTKLKGNTTTTTGPADSKIVFTPAKTAKSELQFFVMSFCPYGNQMEDVLRPVYDLLKDKADITPHYIFDKIDNLDTYCKSRSGDVTQCSLYVQNKYFPTEAECKTTITANLQKCKSDKEYIKAPNGTMYASLHGRQEATEDVREICAWNLNSDKKLWWDFIGNINKNCTAQNADSCWEQEAKKAGLDTQAITDCFNKDGISLIEKEVALTQQYQVQGSPTVLINGTIFPPETAYTQDGKGTLKIGKKVATQDRYRMPNVLKEALCVGFKSAPKECNTTLTDPSGAKPVAGGC